MGFHDRTCDMGTADLETVSEAARLMADCGMSVIGVLDDRQRFTGILTERDITWMVAQGKVASEILLKDVVNDFPVIVDAPISEAAALERMAKAHIRHLMVRDGEDYRIISMRDLVLPHRLVDEPAEASESKERAVPTAWDVMTAPPIACREEALFEEIAEILADRDISGCPVVTRRRLRQSRGPSSPAEGPARDCHRTFNQGFIGRRRWVVKIKELVRGLKKVHSALREGSVRLFTRSLPLVRFSRENRTTNRTTNGLYQNRAMDKRGCDMEDAT